MGGQSFLGAFPESRTKPRMLITIDPNDKKIQYRRSDMEEVETMDYEDTDLLNGLTAALVDMRMK